MRIRKKNYPSFFQSPNNERWIIVYHHRFLSETIHLRKQQSDQILILGFSAEKIQGKPYNNNVYQWCTHH